MRLPSRLAALADRNFRLLFIGQSLSNLGDQMTPVAITFAVLNHHGNARQVGDVLGAGTAAMVIFLLFGGAVADRLPRRLVMLSADALRFVVQSAVAVLLFTDHVSVLALALLSAAWGAGAAFFNPAMTGLLPQLLSGEELQAANALRGISLALGGVIGPAIAGGLVALGGAGSAVAVDAASFAISALTLVRLAVSHQARTGATSMLRDLREGWDSFISRRWLWSIVAEFGLWHLVVLAPLFVLGAVVAKDELGGATAWGLILASFGLGSVLGGILALHWRPRRPLYVATLATLPFVPVPALFAIPAPVPVIVVVIFIGGAGFAVFGTQWETTMQNEVPPEVLSRVSAYDWLGSTALLPAGFLIAGPIAAAIGIKVALWSSSIACLVLTLAVLAVRDVRDLPRRELRPKVS
ncbi:MAG: MFS transporter [Actinomycetota bacterium]|nr:MFS transporter [Actinomycetota bacterium]